MSDSRKIIGFFKTKPGATVIFIVILIAGLGVASQWTAKNKEKKPAAKVAPTAPSSEKQTDSMETDSYQVARDFAPAFDDPNAQRALLAM